MYFNLFEISQKDDLFHILEGVVELFGVLL